MFVARVARPLLILWLSLITASIGTARTLPWHQQHGAANPAPPSHDQIVRIQMATHLCPGSITDTCLAQIETTLQTCNTLQQTLAAQKIAATLPLSAQLNALTVTKPALLGWWCLAERALIDAMDSAGPATFAAMLDKAAALSGSQLPKRMINMAKPGACPESGAVNPFCGFDDLQPPGEEYTPGLDGSASPTAQPPLAQGLEGMEALAQKCLTIDPTKLFGGAATPNEQAEEPGTPGNDSPDTEPTTPEQTAKPGNQSDGGDQTAPPGTPEDPDTYETPNQGMGQPIVAPPVEIPLPPGALPKPPENPNGKNKQAGEVWFQKGDWTVGAWGGKNPDGSYGGGGGFTKSVGGGLGLGMAHSGSVHLGDNGVGFGHADLSILGTFTPTPDAETANWCRERVATITHHCFAAKQPLIDPIASCALKDTGKQAPFMKAGMSEPPPSGPMGCACNNPAGGNGAEDSGGVHGNSNGANEDAGGNIDCPVCCNEQAPTDLPTPGGGAVPGCDCSKCGGGNAPTQVERCAAGTLGAPLNARLCGTIDPTPMAAPSIERAITPNAAGTTPPATTPAHEKAKTPAR